MYINNKKFINELRLRFIDILNSKRGIQSDFAKSIGKPSSYFSEIKRGNPVNALHLKAVGIVLGPEKVVELLDINNKNIENIDLDYEKILDAGEKSDLQKTQISLPEEDQGEPIDITIERHRQVIERFRQKDIALEINEELADLEKLDAGQLKEILGTIKDRKFRLEQEAAKKRAANGKE